MELLTVSQPDGTDIGGTEDYVLDLSFGDTGNTLEVFAPSMPIKDGCLVSIDGTEYGGIIDTVSDSLDGGIATTTWSGRTWHGMLASKILVPSTDYINISDKAQTAIESIIVLADLATVFEAKPGQSEAIIKCQLPRFCDAYTALRHLANAAGSRLRIQRTDGKTLIWLEPFTDNRLDSDALDYKSKTAYHPVNHLVCAGKGELANRTVIHLYADKAGRISKTQSLFGQDEVSMLYNYNNIEDDELEKEGTKKLKELQDQSSIDVTVHDGLNLFIDDVVVAENQDTGRRTQATIGKKIVKAASGVLSVSYEVTAPNQTNGSQGVSFESSGTSQGGGATYVAGTGIRIVGNRISAVMSDEKIVDMEAHIAAAQTAAVTAQGEAHEARAIGNDALTSANSSVKYVTSTSPIVVSKTGSNVSLSLQDSGAKAGSYGLSESIMAGNNANFAIPYFTVDEFGRITSISQSVVTLQISGGGANQGGGFLAAHPIGSIYETTKSFNPSSLGGTWKRLPSLDGFKWERTA